jgi:hypothetical protein
MNEQEQPAAQPQNKALEQQKLPKAGLILGLGIGSIVTCCCYGVPSIILAIIALVMAKKELELYNANPELYSNYDHLKIGRILAFVGLGFGILYLIYLVVYVVIMGGMAMMDISNFM